MKDPAGICLGQVACVLGLADSSNTFKFRLDIGCGSDMHDLLQSLQLVNSFR